MLGRIHRRDALALVALGLIAAGIPLWLAAAAGAIGVPSNDDWVYMRGAESLFRTGSIDMPGHTAAAIGQVVMVQPLLWLSGGDPWAFTAFGLVMALIGVVSSYLLARCFVGTGSALMVGLLVVTFPGFARESAGFMTDVPAFALAQLCLLLGTRWLQGGRRVTLVASLAVGLLGVSIREFAIAAPAAILVAAWARNRADERAWLAGVSGLFVAGVACVLVLVGSTTGRGLPSSPNPWRLTPLGPLFATLAAVVLPAAAVATGRRMADFRPGHILLGVALVGVMFVLPNEPLVGQFWLQDGLGGNAFLGGTRDPVIGPLAWALSGQLALFAAVLVAALAVRWGRRHLARARSASTAVALPIQIARSREAPLVLFLSAYAAELVVFSSVSYPLDRYLYPIVPAAAILLLRGLERAPASAGAGLSPMPPSRGSRSRRSSSPPTRSPTTLRAIGPARRPWRWATTPRGWMPATTGSATTRPGTAAAAGGEGLAWYYDLLPARSPCAVLSNSPLDNGDFRLIREDRAAYLQYLFFGPAQPLYLYGALADGCPVPPAAAAEPMVP